jgi:hypothetical protein
VLRLTCIVLVVRPSFHRPKLRTLAVIGVCAVLGAAAGIAGSAAAPSSTHSSMPPRFGFRSRGALGYGGLFAGPGIGLGGSGPVVHADAVVPNGSGGFETVTLDRGTVVSVSGNQLTITEGTPSATYKTVTLTIASGATVVRDGASTQLSSLQKGDTADVVQTPSTTRVTAFSSGYKPRPPNRGNIGHANAHRGTVASVSGDQLTINTLSGGTQTLTIPAGASIVRDGKGAQLSSLQKGDEVFVGQTPHGVRVIAFSAGSRPTLFGGTQT